MEEVQCHNKIFMSAAGILDCSHCASLLSGKIPWKIQKRQLQYPFYRALLMNEEKCTISVKEYSKPDSRIWSLP